MVKLTLSFVALGAAVGCSAGVEPAAAEEGAVLDAACAVGIGEVVDEVDAAAGAVVLAGAAVAAATGAAAGEEAPAGLVACPINGVAAATPLGAALLAGLGADALVVGEAVGLAAVADPTGVALALKAPAAPAVRNASVSVKLTGGCSGAGDSTQPLRPRQPAVPMLAYQVAVVSAGFRLLNKVMQAPLPRNAGTRAASGERSTGGRRKPACP